MADLLMKMPIPYEPKKKNRFILRFPSSLGINEWYVKSTSRIVVNINVPYSHFEEIQGILITRQGQRVYRDRLDHRIDPRGHSYYWIGGDTPTGVVEDGTDYGAIKSGYISVTPLHLDLTAHQCLEDFSFLKWEPN